MDDPEHPDALTVDSTFAIVPTWVLDHPGLTALDIRLYGVLARYADNEGGCWPSRQTLARRLHTSVSTIVRATRHLVAAGALTISSRHDDAGQQRSNLYRLHVVPGGVSRVTGGGVTSDTGGVSPVTRRTKATERNNPPSPLSRPPWCGVCDDRTRLLDDGGASRRCPTCHPLEVRHGL